MARPVAIGEDDFTELITEDCFYIDKTMFIREWWESGDEVTLITRPRQFGKTLNMSMMERFWSNRYARQGEIFENLAIWQEEKYRELQGTYPVIYLTFAGVCGADYSTARHMLFMVLEELYMDFNYLRNGNMLSDAEKKYWEEISVDMSDVCASNALRDLCSCLYQYYGKKAIILLDGCDKPMQEAYLGGYWNEMAGLIRSLFNCTFKVNPYLERAMMTSVTCIEERTIFSDLNMQIITATSNEYADAFGFTEEEVLAALDAYGLEDQKEEIQKWYGGFAFGNRTNIYNPWSITNYLDEQKYKTYWANTNPIGLISTAIQQAGANLKETMEDLLQKDFIIAKIKEGFAYNQLNEYRDTLTILSFMLASGYLKVLHYEFSADGNFHYELGITNLEMQSALRHMIQNWFNDYFSDFIKALLLGDLTYMNQFMNEFASTSFSNFDTGNELSEEMESEHLASCCDRKEAANGSSLCIGTNLSSEADASHFYHGVVLGLMVGLADRYTIRSNRESGFGRYDVMLRPLTQADDAIILEFKVYNPKKEQDLEETVQAALKQINEKKYEQTLVDQGIRSERIRKYGFAFRGKEVLIGE